MKNSLDSVIEYLEGYGEHPTGLTVRKIQDRSKFLKSSKDGRIIYFETERHNAILGATYIPGLPMSAFLTRWIKYSFDGSELNEVGDSRPSYIDIDAIDFDSLAEEYVFDFSFDLVRDEEGRYWISETMLNGKLTEVSSMADVADYASSLVADWDFDLLIDTSEAAIPEEAIEKISNKLRSGVVSAVKEKARDAAKETSGFS